MGNKEEFVRLCQLLNIISRSPYSQQLDDDDIYKMLSTNNGSEHLYFHGIDLSRIYQDLKRLEVYDLLIDCVLKN